MNTKVKIAFILLIAVVMVAGCKKEDVKSIKRVQKTVVEISNNPYAIVGEIHNLCLDYIIANANSNILFDTTLCKQEINTLASAFLDNIEWYTALSVDSFFVPSLLSDTFSISYENYLTADQVNSWNVMQENVLFAFTINNMSQIQNYISDYNDYISNVSDVNQKTILYIANSILYSSCVYWMPILSTGIVSPWTNVLSVEDENGIELSYGLGQEAKESIVKADAIGGAVGGIKGGVKGAIGSSIMPGVGTVTGFIGGALWGGIKAAIEASAVEAAVQIAKEKSEKEDVH